MKGTVGAWPGPPLHRWLRIVGLAQAPTLLVIDNCEHVLDTVADLLDLLLPGCPPLSVLATSREPVGITGETVLRVPSLSLGDAGTPGEAERLFVERARASDPSWQPTDEELVDVRRVCERLDGLPLAIELAAARVRALAVAEVRERLETSFALVAAGRRAALPRQRTLEATVAWSHDLLDGDERLALAALSAFVGTFELTAAEPVLATLTSAPALDLVEALVDKSLLQVVRLTSPTRYRMLETVRFYARQRLAETGQAEDVAAAHLRWAMKRASLADELLMGGASSLGEAAEVLEELCVPDLRAAVHHAEQVGDVDAGLSIVVDLYQLVALGSRREALDWLRSFLEIADASGADPVLHSRARGCLSEVLAFAHDADGALREADRAMELLADADDPVALGWAHHNRAMALWVAGEVDGARAADEIAQAAFRRGRHPLGLARCTYELAVWEIAHGTVERANEHRDAMAQVRTPTGAASPIAHLHVLEIDALVALRQSELETARDRLLAAVGIQREMAFGQCVAHLLDHCALWSARDGDGAAAAELLGAAAAVRSEMIGTDVQPFEQAFHEQAASAARADLGEDAFSTHHGLGAELSLLGSLDLAATTLTAGSDRGAEERSGEGPGKGSDESPSGRSG